LPAQNESFKSEAGEEGANSKLTKKFLAPLACGNLVTASNSGTLITKQPRHVLYFSSQYSTAGSEQIVAVRLDKAQ